MEIRNLNYNLHVIFALGVNIAQVFHTGFCQQLVQYYCDIPVFQLVLEEKKK